MADELKQAFDRAWQGSEQRSWVRGLLGKSDGAGGYIVAVADRPGHVYVRVSNEGILTVTTARTNGSIPARGNLPVRMRLEPGAGYTIYDVDPAYYEAAVSGDTPNAYGVASHTHLLDSGNTYLAEAQRMEPGLVRPAGGWMVTISPFRFRYSGTWYTYAGETISLLSNKPSTTGKHRLVLVAVNPATNAAVAINGSDADYATALTQADIDSITAVTRIPLGAVLIREDDTAITTQTKYIDARLWLGSDISSDFDDTEGDPANVANAAADGTSVYPARRDHVHPIGLADGSLEFDGTDLKRAALGGDVASGEFAPNTLTIQKAAVDDVMLRDSAALSVIGRATNTAGVPADIAAAATSDAVLRESGSTVGFGTVATGGIAANAVTNAKLAQMAEKRIKGRAGAGTGDPTDLTPVQVMGIVGGVLYIDNNGAGNVATGEDTLSTFTIPAGTLVAFTTMHFEIVGVYAGNANLKTIRVYFGGNEIFSYAATTASEYFTIQGRVLCAGDSAQKIWTHYFSDVARKYVHDALTVDSSFGIDFEVTGEAAIDNDIQVETVLLTWTAPFV